jgi:hypothetical protein
MVARQNWLPEGKTGACVIALDKRVALIRRIIACCLNIYTSSEDEQIILVIWSSRTGN